MRRSFLVAVLLLPAIPIAAQNPAATLSVDVKANRHAINPNIYGVAFGTTAQVSDLNVPLNRYGGNSSTRYNWQINADNRGEDWYFESLADDSSTAGERGDTFIAASRAGGAQALITVPMIGWIAKVGANRGKLASFSIAKYGAQTGSDWQWFADAGNGIWTNGSFVSGNDPSDANVPNNSQLQGQWVQAIVNKWGLAQNGGQKYYLLDNEHSIWHATHRDVHPAGASMDEILGRTKDFAAQIKAVDPGALIAGPEEWGWSGYFYSGYDQQWGNLNGWGIPLPDRTNHGGADYLPWLLSGLKADGRHLLDIFTIHYYPESGEFGNDTSTAMQLLRNKSTRSLWDPNYVDQSWINDKVNLIPRLRNWVNTYYYAGTPIGITEYNWGAEGHINGATSQADVLGIFGREGLDLAARWTTPDASTPVYKAMKLYRNYDGNKSAFGDVSVSATAANPDNLAAFGAQRTTDGAVTLMVISKYLSGNTPVTVNVANFANSGKAQVYRLTAANIITRLSDISFNGSSIAFTAPPQSITLLVLPAGISSLSGSIAPNSGSGVSQLFTATFVNSNGNSQIGSARILFSASAAAQANACHLQYDRPSSTLALMNDAGTSWSAGVKIGSAGSLQNSQCAINVAGASFVYPDGTSVALTVPVTFKPSFGGAKNVFLSVQDLASGSVGPTQQGTWTVPAASPPLAVSLSPSAGSGSGDLFTVAYDDSNGWQNLAVLEILIADSTSAGLNCYVGYNPGTNSLAAGAATGTVGSGSVLNGSNCLVDPSRSSTTKLGNTVKLTVSVSFLSGLAGQRKVFAKATNQSNLSSNWQQLGTYLINATPASGGMLPANGQGLTEAFSFTFSSPNGYQDIKAGEVWITKAGVPPICYLCVLPSCYLYVDRPGNAVYLANDTGNGFVSPVILGTATSARNSNCQVSGVGSRIVSAANTSTITLVLGFFGPMLGTQAISTRARGLDSTGGLMSEWQLDGTYTVSIAPVISGWTPTPGAGSTGTFSTVVSDPYGLDKWVQFQFASGSALGTTPYCYVHYDRVGNGLWLYQGPGPLDFQGPVKPGTTATLGNSFCVINAAGSSVTSPTGPSNSFTIDLSLSFIQPSFSGTKSVYLRAADQIGNDTGFSSFGVWTVP